MVRVVTEARIQEFARVRDTVVAWATNHDLIDAVALVGSWARGVARMDSDVDVVVLTTSGEFVEAEEWVRDACGDRAGIVRTANWGPLTERRVRLASGFEIEFGFAPPSWAETKPVDPGTHEVISDGYEIWYDPALLLASLVAAVEQ